METSRAATLPAIRATRIAPVVAFLPTIVAVVAVFVGCLLWTVFVSFTDSRSIPDLTLSGFGQWTRLFTDYRWRTAMGNMFVFAAFYIAGCLVLGYVLAVCIDQRVHGENFFRTVFLCPHALSFIVTGQIWKWCLDPEFGLQKFVRDLGWTTFTFDWIADRHMAIYTIVIAGVWQSIGVVMVLMLAGLRGIDEDLWKATRVDGIPPWRVYTEVVPPMMVPMLLTSVALLGTGAVKNYDLVIAMTDGGPGIATDVPSKFVMEYLFERSNIGLAAAGAATMLLVTLAVSAPLLVWGAWQKRRRPVRGE
ncbi:MAG TPA: sugar ABC transporter permease [Ramlibacter sp.]|uniref:carbohydrate ABC transporter permease n=1 Tax=Ramlibacter sp. TaxID=1917967 RepID=UPI002BA86DA5|nr:sugar ABC transporter permease [Ramlibacter sp.]HVZ45850.1 sugar ABC transporter permease [Ramlibacter sp.]